MIIQFFFPLNRFEIVDRFQFADDESSFDSKHVLKIFFR